MPILSLNRTSVGLKPHNILAPQSELWAASIEPAWD